MLKRFLKFLKGEEQAPDESFEGSYLDHLLEQVRPTTVEQLEECSDHDPLLLIVVNVLRTTMMNVWNPKLRCPVVDSQSPGMRPPPPPAESAEGLVVESDNPVPESDSTTEFQSVDPPDEDEAGDALTGDPDVDDDGAAAEADDQDDEANETDGDATAADDEADAPPAVEAADDQDDDEDDEDDDGSSDSKRRITEEIDVAEIEAAGKAYKAARSGGDEARADQTIESDRYVLEPERPVDPTVEIDKQQLFETQNPDERPRVDTEEVLQAGRVFLGLLIENDRLPTDLQLSVAETIVARDLLLGYFVGKDDFDHNARRLLGLVEQKFGEGLFSQARILLQLFHTDEQTRVNNDRNLFYEDMILRLGIRRRHRLSDEELGAFADKVDNATDDAGIDALAEWLAEECLIKFHFFVRDPESVASWRRLADRSSRTGVVDNFLRYLPPRRWRPIDTYPTLTPGDQAKRHITVDTARDYVIDQIKTCYFVLRAVGDTGLEGYLDTFFDWTEEAFGLNGTVLMPVLYKRSMMDTEPMAQILRELYTEYFAEGTEKLLADIEESDVEEALVDAVAEFGDCDLGEVAPGYYDLGAFVFDKLFGLEYPTREFPFKVHRIT